MKKKANVVMDSIVFVIVILVFSLITFFSWTAFDDIKTDVYNDITLNESKETITEVETRYPSVFDGLIVFVLLGMWAFGIVSAVIREDHPVLFGFMMILLVFVIIAAAMLGNFYEELFQDSLLAGITDSFPASNWILTHILELSIVVGLSILLVLLGKNRL